MSSRSSRGGAFTPPMIWLTFDSDLPMKPAKVCCDIPRSANRPLRYWPNLRCGMLPAQ
jgi:hypothetical protein